MKNCILYTTKHGSTEKTARMLKEKLHAETDLINLMHEKDPDLSGYDTIILGASIYIGKIQKKMVKFIDRNLKELLSKNIALYILAGEKDKPEDSLHKAYPETLLYHSFAKGYFGYEMNLDKMNFLEKAAMKAMKITENKSEILEDAIQKMADEVNKL